MVSINNLNYNIIVYLDLLKIYKKINILYYFKF